MYRDATACDHHSAALGAYIFPARHRNDDLCVCFNNAV